MYYENLFKHGKIWLHIKRSDMVFLPELAYKLKDIKLHNGNRLTFGVLERHLKHGIGFNTGEFWLRADEDGIYYTTVDPKISPVYADKPDLRDKPSVSVLDFLYGHNVSVTDDEIINLFNEK